MGKNKQGKNKKTATPTRVKTYNLLTHSSLILHWDCDL